MSMQILKKHTSKIKLGETQMHGLTAEFDLNKHVFKLSEDSLLNYAFTNLKRLSNTSCFANQKQIIVRPFFISYKASFSTHPG